MGKITLYHGSPDIIEKPEYGKGKSYNDYGLGFYCTEHSELAKEWACSSELDGYANAYTIDTDGLKILLLTNGNYHILNWLFVLLQNRKFRIDSDIAAQAKLYIENHFAVEYRSYDMIKGYRADDSYFSFANAFLSNTISITQLERAMVLGKLGEQIVAISKRAFERFQFVDAISAPKEIYYPKKLSRDTNAREEFRKEKGRGNILTEKYMIDIIREGWLNEDERLQRVILK